MIVLNSSCIYSFVHKKERKEGRKKKHIQYCLYRFISCPIFLFNASSTISCDSVFFSTVLWFQELFSQVTREKHSPMLQTGPVTCPAAFGRSIYTTPLLHHDKIIQEELFIQLCGRVNKCLQVRHAARDKWNLTNISSSVQKRGSRG